MSLYVLALVIVAAVLHASWNLLAKKTEGGIPFIWLLYVASNILYLPFLLYQINQGTLIYSPPMLWFSLSSSLLHLVYFIVLQKGYRVADLSVVYPLARGSAPVVSFFAAILLLHEPLRLTALLGLFLITAGVLLVTGLKFGKENSSRTRAGVTYGLLTGLFIALYTYNDAVAIKTYHVSPLIITLAGNCFSAIFLLPFIMKKKDEVKQEIEKHKWIIIAVALLSPAAYILVLEALKYAPLSLVAPARETSILVGVFMGSKVLNEQDGKRRIFASLLILGGIIALSLS